MLNFFRNFRKSLVYKGKFSRYLTYALGEIILVMIGILLALQVNNWNEERKSDEMMSRKVQLFMKDLEHNINEANAIIDFADEYDSIFDLVISDKEIDDPITNYNTLLGTQTANFFKDNLESILENEERLPEQYLPLIPDLKRLDRLFQSQQKWEDISLQDREDITKNVIYTDDYDFTSLNQDEAKIEFEKLISSNQFRNRVLLSYGNTFLVENAWDVTLIRAATANLLLRLKFLSEESDQLDVEDFFVSRGLVPFKSIGCETGTIPSRYSGDFGSYRMAFPFYNATNETRQIEFLDEDLNGYKVVTLAPKAFHFNEYELYDEDRLIVSDGEKCLAGYSIGRNGFLVIME